MLVKYFYMLFGVLLSANCQKCGEKQLTNSGLIKTYSEGNLNFALNIYKKASVGIQNAFISPFSISVALAMTSAGAGGKTLKQISNTLNLNKFNDEIKVHQAIHSVLTSVCSTPDYTLSMANRMYVQKDFAINTPFRNTLTESYESSAESANFKRKANQETKGINSWVEKQTQNQIQGLFPPGSLDSTTIVVLVNAIYFKGNWENKFPKTDTKPEDFKLINGRKVSNPMMNFKKSFKYAESKQLKSQVIELPYKGDRLVMYVILPKEVDGINRLRGQLTADSFKSMKKDMVVQDVTVKLPKFKLNYRQNLNEVLSQLGMRNLFDQNEANLTRIAQLKNRNLYVSMVMHQASVSVDEEGTTAATTGLGASRGPSVRPPSVNFIADHPFVFTIYDKLTDLIIFIGSIDDPSI